ncbi:hypothetical protein [Candidatus Poseidonia alphae]|uniref:hypothetical protein n=1 Tax=Candidatus Poseidonia alphae TaxID=1915863 RepID=UPI0030C776AE
MRLREPWPDNITIQRGHETRHHPSVPEKITVQRHMNKMTGGCRDGGHWLRLRGEALEGDARLIVAHWLLKSKNKGECFMFSTAAHHP